MNPAQFLGMEDKKKGSKPWSPGRDPSKAAALGRKGTAAERSEATTISFHFRSGMAAKEEVDLVLVAGAKAAAEPAIARAAAMVFMVKNGVRRTEGENEARDAVSHCAFPTS